AFKSNFFIAIALPNLNLIKIERYVCFDKIAEGSIQALPNNNTKEKTNNETLTYQDLKNLDNNIPVDTSTVFTLQESSKSAIDSAVDKNQILLKEDNEDNDCKVLNNEIISIQAPQEELLQEACINVVNMENKNYVIE
ncbi:7733_t:CDS:2, partial [Racocetra fulgida]